MTPPHSLPLSPKIGGQTNNCKPRDNQYLTGEQARHHLQKDRSQDGIINADTLHQEIE